MKKLILLTLLLVTTLFVNAQGPFYLWEKGASGTGRDEPGALATDLSGNVIVAGFFLSDTLNCDGNTLIGSGNSWDLFIIKYDPAGTVTWAKKIGGPGTYCAASSLVTDASGNIYMAGGFVGDNLTIGTNTLTGDAFSAYNTSFITKMDAAGNVLWAQSLYSSPSFADIHHVKIDGAGNVLIEGSFGGASLNIGTSTIYGGGGSANMFCAKYDPSGNVLWANSSGGTDGNGGSDISVDASGNAIVTGYFKGNLTFGATTLSNPDSSGYSDVFVVKYTNAGSVLWAKRLDVSNWNSGAANTTDASGNIYVASSFGEASVTLDGITINNSGSIGLDDVYVIKYDASGTPLWAKAMGVDTVGEGVSDITTDAAGNFYVLSARVVHNVSGGPTWDTLAPPSQLAKYDDNGNQAWLKYLPGGNNMGIDGSNDLFIAGSFTSHYAYFDANTLYNPVWNVADVFVAKISGVYNPPCFAHYTTAYDSTTHTFNLTVDSTTTSMATAYSWDFGDGTTSTLTAPSHTYAVDSVYNVCMKVYDIYGDSCTYCHAVGIDSVGNVIRNAGFTINVSHGTTTNIAATADESYTTLFPNPGTGVFYVRSSEDVLKAEVLNVLGQQIYSFSPARNSKDQTLQLDLSSEQNGIYFVKLTTAKGTTTKRICISR